MTEYQDKKFALIRVLSKVNIKYKDEKQNLKELS